jgi:hypothetical protein
MRKFILLGLGVVSAFAFTLQTGKVYQCVTYGVSFKDKNQTRSIINRNKKTQLLLKQSLKDFYSIKVEKKDKKTVELILGKIKQPLKNIGTWRGYQRYVAPRGEAIFMPDKNASSKDAAIILPMNKLVIYYKCK